MKKENNIMSVQDTTFENDLVVHTMMYGICEGEHSMKIIPQYVDNVKF